MLPRILTTTSGGFHPRWEISKLDTAPHAKKFQLIELISQSGLFLVRMNIDAPTQGGPRLDLQ